MDLSHLKTLAFCVALLALAGCSAASKKIEHDNPQSKKAASMVGDAQPGDLVSLPGNSGLGMNSVVIDRTYSAASGRQCRQMRTVDGVPIQRVACKGGDGVWSLARDLRPSNSIDATKAVTNGAINANRTNDINQSLVPSAGSLMLLHQEETIVPAQYAAPVEAIAIQPRIEPLSAAEPENELVKHTVNVNETLWSFAKRTTGNALNWETIAQINGISNARTLATGTQLFVPAELVGDGG